jgi:hypothetical protein
MKPKKLSLYFSEFSTVFYAIYKILENNNTIGDPLLHRGPWNFLGIHIYALGSHLGPWKDSRPRNRVPGPLEAAARWNPAAPAWCLAVGRTAGGTAGYGRARGGPRAAGWRQARRADYPA